MKLMIDEFYEEKNRLAVKELTLQGSIATRQALIDSNEEKYKGLLRNGKEEEADKLFEEQQSLKLKNSSDSKKLNELKPIHKEFLQEKALSALDTDLIPLMKEQIAEALKIVQEEKDIRERLQTLQGDRERKRVEINDVFRKYDRLAEDMKLRESHRSRFNKEPYRFIDRAGDHAFTEAERKVKQSGGIGK